MILNFTNAMKLKIALMSKNQTKSNDFEWKQKPQRLNRNNLFYQKQIQTTACVTQKI